MNAATAIRVSAAWPVLIAGCLSASEEHPGYSPALLDKDAKIARVDDDKAGSQRLDLADGVNGPKVALHTGWLDGKPVQYWDFGNAVATAEPVWQFRRHGAHGAVETIGHLDLVDSAPGDMSYSPLRVIYRVFVTDAYAGERITSLQALDDAIEIGLVETPKRTKTFANWPMTLAATTLEQAGGKPPLAPKPIYYRGKIASYFDPAGTDPGVGRFQFMMEPIMAPNAYVLRKQNASAPLDEAALHMDLDGDGDMVDSNVVFEVGAGDPKYASIWHEIDVTVAADYAFGASSSEADLFERTKMGGLGAAKSGVIAYTDGGMMLLNRILLPGAP